MFGIASPGCDFLVRFDYPRRRAIACPPNLRRFCLACLSCLHPSHCLAIPPSYWIRLISRSYQRLYRTRHLLNSRTRYQCYQEAGTSLKAAVEMCLCCSPRLLASHNQLLVTCNHDPHPLMACTTICLGKLMYRCFFLDDFIAMW